MNNKEKIGLFKTYIKDSKKVILPRELQIEVALQSNILKVTSECGAFICIRELQREEREKEVIKIQKNQIEFTRILALATTVLALGIFIELILRLLGDLSILMGRSSFIEFVLVFLPILVIILITIELIRYYCVKTGWKN